MQKNCDSRFDAASGVKMHNVIRSPLMTYITKKSKDKASKTHQSNRSNRTWVTRDDTLDIGNILTD